MQNLISTALPSLGVGAAGGAAALKLVDVTKASPATVAGLLAAVGGLGSALAKKGGMVSTGAASLAAVGAGLTTIDFMQKPTTTPARQLPPAQQPHPQAPHGPPVAQRQAELVTREELDEAVRELKELRNAIGVMVREPQSRDPQFAMPMMRPQYDPSPFYEEPIRRDADAVIEEVMHEGHRNAAEAWHDAGDFYRNADHVIEEVVHPHGDGSAARNADGHPLMESWHHVAGEAA